MSFKSGQIVPATAIALGLLVGRTCFAEESEKATAPSRYLSRVESAVFETTGDRQTITKRAIICIAQVIMPGVVTAPTIISSDTDAGIIVANNSFEYSVGLLKNTARTTLTIEARDGRFRIVHTNIEQFMDASYGWTPIMSPSVPFSGGATAEKAIQSVSNALAACISAKPSIGGNW